MPSTDQRNHVWYVVKVAGPNDRTYKCLHCSREVGANQPGLAMAELPHDECITPTPQGATQDGTAGQL